MDNVKITVNGHIIEVGQISVYELRELLHSNGNGHSAELVHAPNDEADQTLSISNHSKPEYGKLKQALSGNTKKFVTVLAEHPSGIDGEKLTEKLELHNTNQIGGVTGGGLGKLLHRFHVPKDSIYTSQITRRNGQRVVIYSPGPEIEKVL